MLRRIKGVTLRNTSVEADQGCDTIGTRVLMRIKGVILRYGEERDESVEVDQRCDTKVRRGERRNWERFSKLKTSPWRGMDTRFEDGRIICLKQTLKMEVRGTMGKGRPGMRWMDNIRHEMNECGLYKGAPLTEEGELGWCNTYSGMRVFFRHGNVIP